MRYLFSPFKLVLVLALLISVGINLLHSTLIASETSTALNTITITREMVISAAQDALENYTDYNWKVLGLAVIEFDKSRATSETQKFKNYILNSVKERLGAFTNSNFIMSLDITNFKVKNTDITRLGTGPDGRTLTQYDLTVDPTLAASITNGNNPSIEGTVRIEIGRNIEDSNSTFVRFPDSVKVTELPFKVELHHRNILKDKTTP